MWTVSAEGPVARLHFESGPDDPEGETWTGWAEIFRGAPSWESHPEIFHALKALQNPVVHQPHVTAWSWDVPDEWRGVSNVGEHRKYMLLSGGRLSWSLVLKLSPRSPFFVFEALARAFNATLQEVSYGSERPEPASAVRVLGEGLDPESAEVAA